LFATIIVVALAHSVNHNEKVEPPHLLFFPTLANDDNYNNDGGVV
jgi:hypothetical protein